jgi:hypothetical protein
MTGTGFVDELRAKGWSLRPGYLDAGALAALRAEATALADAPGLHQGCSYFLDRFPDGLTRPARVERVAEVLPALAAHGLLDRMAEEARACLGGPVVLFKDKLNLRYPGSPGYAPHQDAARWQGQARAFLSFGLFLQASDGGRGGFSFGRYDPAEGLLATSTGDFDAARFAAMPQVEVAAQAGDALMIDGAAPHATADNRSDARLLHLLITFAQGSDAGMRDAYYAAQDRAFAAVRSGNLFTFDRR